MQYEDLKVKFGLKRRIPMSTIKQAIKNFENKTKPFTAELKNGRIILNNRIHSNLSIEDFLKDYGQKQYTKKAKVKVNELD